VPFNTIRIQEHNMAHWPLIEMMFKEHLRADIIRNLYSQLRLNDLFKINLNMNDLTRKTWCPQGKRSIDKLF